MTAAREPRSNESYSPRWDPFGPNPLAPIPEEDSAVEPVRLRLVREKSNLEPAPATTSTPVEETPPAAPSAPTPEPAPAPEPKTPTTPDSTAETDDEAPVEGASEAALARAQAWVQATWWMPNLFTERPASVVEVVAYAETGAQHAREDGPARNGSKLWGYLVAAPASTVLYFLAYLLQRPGRAATVGIVLLLAWLAWVTS